MTVQTDNYGIGASGIASQKFTFTAPNDGTFKLGRGVLGAESSFPLVVNADDSISGNMGIGAGQTWQDVTGSRALTTTYTNSTGRPIEVSVTVTIATSQSVTATVAGVAILTDTASAAEGRSFQFIVPNGATYQVTATGGSTLSKWAELR